jgi:hypothetical protein
MFDTFSSITHDNLENTTLQPELWRDEITEFQTNYQNIFGQRGYGEVSTTGSRTSLILLKFGRDGNSPLPVQIFSSASGTK